MLVVLLWGSNWAVMKSGLKVVGPLNFVMQRLLFAALTLSPFLIYLREKIPRDRNTWLRLLLLSLISATNMVSTNVGLTYEKSGLSAVLTYTQPLFVFCLAVSFLKEEASSRRFLGIVIGFFGVTVLYLGRNFSSATISFPIFFLLFGAFIWSVKIVYYKKFLSHVNPVITSTIQFTVGAIILSTLSVTFEGFSFSMTSTYILIVLYMSVGASAIAFTLWMLLLQEEEATVVSSSSLIVPMVALIFGWLFLQENMELESVLGFILILTGVYLVNKGNSNKDLKKHRVSSSLVNQASDNAQKTH